RKGYQIQPKSLRRHSGKKDRKSIQHIEAREPHTAGFRETGQVFEPHCHGDRPTKLSVRTIDRQQRREPSSPAERFRGPDPSARRLHPRAVSVSATALPIAEEWTR